jgi:hypothetical protein
MAGQAQLSLEDILAGVNPGGQEKIASEHARDYSPEDTRRAEVLARLDKVASDFSEEEVMKVAASAKLTGEIMTEIILGNIKEAMPYILQDALNKVAVGTSDTEPGLERVESQHNVDRTEMVRAKEDSHGKGGDSEPNVDQHLHSNKTEGAMAAGGPDPEAHQGKPTTNLQGSTVNKVSQDLSANIHNILKQAMGGEYGIPGAGGGMGGSPEEMLAMLLQQQQSGQPLTPEQQQLLQTLMAQAGGGMGGAGGMVRQASAQDQSERSAQIRHLFSSFGI